MRCTSEGSIHDYPGIIGAEAEVSVKLELGSKAVAWLVGTVWTILVDSEDIQELLIRNIEFTYSYRLICSFLGIHPGFLLYFCNFHETHAMIHPSCSYSSFCWVVVHAGHVWPMSPHFTVLIVRKVVDNEVIFIGEYSQVVFFFMEESCDITNRYLQTYDCF